MRALGTASRSRAWASSITLAAWLADKSGPSSECNAARKFDSLAPQDGGGLGAGGCPPGERRDKVRQGQRGGNGNEDRDERDDWVGQHAELPREGPPPPPAARDAVGSPMRSAMAISVVACHATVAR